MICYPVFDHVPHIQYLEGNEPASPDEQEDILAFIRRASRHRDQLIYQLQDMVFVSMTTAMHMHGETLNQEVNRLDSRIRDAQIIVSPVRHLTFDALQEIFVRCLPRHISDTGNTYNTQLTDLNGSFKAALTLSHVCKHWRSTSLCLPRLWGNLPTHTEATYHHTRHKDCLPLYQTMVERSRNSGLNFFLDLSLSYGSVDSFESNMREAEDHMDPVVSFLIEHSARWTNVVLSNLSFKHVLKLSNIKGHLTNLTYLEVRNHEYGSSTQLVSFMDLLDGTSKLRTFVANGHCYCTYVPGPMPSFRLQHLTTIEMNLHSPRDLRDIATFCSETLQSLNIASLSTIGGPGYHSDPDNVYEFPQLTRLDLSCSTGNTFNFLRMPSLECLTWTPIPVYNYEPPLLPLYEMISRSSDSLHDGHQHPLKELRVTADLCSLKPEGPNLIHLFSLVPNLSTLRIPIPSMLVIQALTEDVKDPAPQRLPSLEVCIFTHQLYPHLPDDLRDTGTFTLGLAKSLNEFAASRCEWASVPPMYEERSSQEGKQSVKRLKSFQILLNGHDCIAGSYLYRSLLRSLVPKMCKTPSSFRYLLKTLAHDVPGAFGNIWDPWSPTDPPVWHGCWNQWRSRVVRTLTQIAALDLDIWTIIVSLRNLLTDHVLVGILTGLEGKWMAH